MASPPTDIKGSRALMLLVGVTFVLSFILIFSVTLRLGGYLLTSTTPLEPDQEAIFPESFIVQGPSSSYRVANAVDLDPSRDNDFLFVIWFKLRHVLSEDERVTFVAKYDPNSKLRAGYSIALQKDTDGVRPLVYWQDESGQGHWYTFATMSVPAQSWVMLGLSFRSNQYLGLHGAVMGDTQGVKLLGGYDLEKPMIPTSESDLVIGAFGGSKFRGRIGPVGIAKPIKLGERLIPILNEVISRPLEIPATLSTEEVTFWTNGKADVTEHQHPIEQRNAIREKDVKVAQIEPSRATR